MKKDELSKICEEEFEVFSTGIVKMGFDPQGFALMVLLDKKTLEKALKKFTNLTEEEKVAVENRIKLFS